MEFCSGSSLRTYLDNPKREVVIPTVLEMFRKLLEGVRMIHSHGILHRDLKYQKTPKFLIYSGLQIFSSTNMVM
jgi:serine/threonine protein kinase